MSCSISFSTAIGSSVGSVSALRLRACVRVCVCARVKLRFQQAFIHIMTVSGCDIELKAHFYSAA